MGINANYMTWNPLYLIDSSYPPTVPVEQGNLVLNTNNSNVGIGATQSFFTGKWYYEILVVTEGKFLMGLLTLDTFNSQKVQPHNRTGSYWVDNDGTKYVQSANSTISGFNPSDGDIIQFAFDRDARKLWVGLNGTYVGSGNPSAGSNELFSASDFAISTGAFMPAIGLYNSATTKCILNAGQDSSFIQNKTSGSANATDANGFGNFFYTPPTNFLACASPNIPTSSDIDPAGDDGETDNNSKHFGAITYAGSGGAQTISGLGFKPDLVWCKMVSSSQNNQLFDTSRLNSRSTPFMLRSDSASAQLDDQSTGNNDKFISAFNDDGFVLGGSGSGPNDNNRTYSAWCWKFAGGTTATNNVGNVQTTTQANTKAGQSIVTWTGTGTNSRTIGTGLTKKAEFVIIKSIAESNSWIVWHHQAKQGALPNDYGVLVLNSSQAYGEGSGALTYWDVSEWTDTVFSVGGANGVNGSSDSMLAYAWHSVEGFSKFGCFNGNADNDGTFVYTGFKPTMLWIKNTQSTSPWCVYDTARPTYNPSYLVAWDETTAQNTSSYPIDILSNGFKLRTSNATINSAHTWVFGAWGNPSFKYNNTF